MCPSLIQIGSKTAEKNSAQTNKQTNKQTNRHYENKSLGREPIAQLSRKLHRVSKTSRLRLAIALRHVNGFWHFFWQKSYR